MPRRSRTPYPTTPRKAQKSHMMHPWHAIRTRYSTQLAIVAKTAELTQEVYCPTYTKTTINRGQRREITTPYFPMYFFARWDAHDAALWHTLKGLPGLTGFVGGQTPDPILDHEMVALKSFIDELKTHPQTCQQPHKFFPPGTTILIMHGVFSGRVGIVESVSPKSFSITVKLEGLLGRNLAIPMPSQWCELAENATPINLGTAQRNRKRGRRGGSFRRSSRYPSAVV